jgi:hypothetical protein
MTSPFAEIALQLWELGYSVVPLEYKSKAIKLPNWSRYCDEQVNRETLDYWLSMGDKNIGLALGKASGVIAVDFDYDVDDHHAKILDIIGDSIVKKRGAKGWTGFYQYGNQKSLKYSINNQSVVEILARGRQTVLPPSMHPEGMAYEWITTRTLLDTQPHELPCITPEQMLALDKLFKHHRDESVILAPVSREPLSQKDEIHEALTHLSSDDYDLWVQIGMALKDELGDAGYGLWDVWSSKSSKYQGAQFTYKKWQSFKFSGIHIETLFWHSLNAGYKPIYKPIDDDNKPLALILGDNDLQDTVIIEEAPEAAVEAVTVDSDALGLVGMIAKYIDDTAIYPMPELALAAALTLAGFIMGRKAKSEIGIHPNLYCLGVAASGSGKDHARKCVRKILMECGLDSHEIGVPKSGAAIVTNLYHNGGKGIMLIDEFGRFLEAISSPKSSSHEKEITTSMMEIYTSTDSYYSGAAYANHDGKMKSLKIAYPFLSMYPVTTKERLYETLTKKEALDGFLARFIVFEVKHYPSVGRRVQSYNVPPELAKAVRAWQEVELECNMVGDETPMVIPFDDKAREMFYAFQESMRLEYVKELEKDNGFHAVYARLAEQAVRFALAAHSGGDISASVMQWAIELALTKGRQMMDVIKNNITSSDREKRMNKLIETMKLIAKESHGKVKHSDLVARSRWLNGKEIAEMIQNLVEAGDIEKYTTDPSKAGRKGIYYEFL